MKTLLLICLFVTLLNSTNAQPFIRGTIKSGNASNKVELWLQPEVSNSTEYLFQIQFPIAFPSNITPQPTGLQVTLDPAFATAFGGNTYNVSVVDIAPNTAGTENYFVVTLTRTAVTGPAASAPQTWTGGQEFKVLTASFLNTSPTPFPSTMVKLADYQDMGSNGQGNFFTINGNNFYYYDFANSMNNFYAVSGESTIGGDASAGFAETVDPILLPVSLLNFSGFKNANKNTLRWTTTGESNSKGFDVQRSSDGTSYSTIGYVNSLATGGNSTSNLSYSFDDNSPVAGKKQFYRLKQIDIDGRSKLSEIVMINGDKPKSLSIGGLFPNPASNTIKVIIDAPKQDNVTLLVMDISGKTVKQQSVNVNIGSNTVPVDITLLAKGSYLLKLVCKTSECETATGKFTKQ